MPAEGRVCGIPALSAGQLATMRALAIDRMTAEVLSAFDSARVPCILLKGPTVADWLYERGALRAYTDSDLLVSPDRLAGAHSVLAELGFAPDVAESPHAVAWRRPDGAAVDLHTNLPGLVGPLPPEEAWNRLAELTESMPVGGTTATVLNTNARALLVVLHAAHHGPEQAQPLEDLSRAVERVGDEKWTEIAELAWQLQAGLNFTRGLRLLAEGAELADRLALPRGEFVEAVVEAATGPGARAPLALGFERLAAAPDVRTKLALILRELFPSPAFLRQWSRLARHGGAPGLVAAYGWRLLWIVVHAVPSLAAWRRARRVGGTGAV
ncbi:MAG: nucleotidyltransferase family protein [Solirubrobacterales bacterium]